MMIEHDVRPFPLIRCLSANGIKVMNLVEMIFLVRVMICVLTDFCKGELI